MQLRAAHRYGAAVAGVACREANNHRTMECDDQGNVSTVIKRDSIGRQNIASYCISTEQSAGPLNEDAPARKRADSDIELDSFLPPDFPVAQDAMSLHMAAHLLDRTSTDIDDSYPFVRPAHSTSSVRTSDSRAPAKPKRPRVDMRSIAIQAAAFANRISDMARMPTLPATASAEGDPLIRSNATSLALTASEPRSSSRSGCTHAQATPASTSQDGKDDVRIINNQSRASFVDRLKALAQRDPCETRQSRARSLAAPTVDLPSHPSSRVPVHHGGRSLPAHASRPAGLTDAMRRLMGRW